MKFTNEGCVKISFKEKIDHLKRKLIEVSVKDTGSGIDPNVINNLTNLFETHDNLRHDNPKGIGIGLFNISKFI